MKINKCTMNWFKNIFFLGVIFVISAVFNDAKSCHALAVSGFTVTEVSGGVEIDANSTSPTCGCGDFWLDIEVRCLNENFDGAPFDPTQYLALDTYPYFQSATMLKPSCTVQAYPTTFIPFTSLCEGVDYQVRVRENNNGNAGPWSTPLTFEVPGTYTPFTAQIDVTSTTVCEGDCATVEAVVTGGCTQAPVFDWNSGQASGTSQTVCPELDTTLYVSITEQCTGDVLEDSITIQVVDTIAAGDATIMPSIGGTPGLITDACEGESVLLMLEGYAGDIQWQEGPGPTGPWTNIPGGTQDTTVTDPVLTDMCFRAEIEGCGDVEYSNEICVEIAPKPNLTVEDKEVCQGESVDVYADVDIPGGDFMWNGIPSQNQPELLNNYPSNNTEYIVQYELNGCTVYDTSFISVNATPVVDFLMDSVCQGDATGFTNETTLDDNNGDVISAYLWNFDDGNTSNQANPTNNYVDEGVYDVQLIVTSNFGCVDSITKPTPVFPNPEVDFTPIDACLEAENQFNDLSTVSTDYTQNTLEIWDWSFGDGNSSNEQNPEHLYENEGTFNVDLTVTTGNGCSESLSKPVIVHPRPQVNFNTEPIQGCAPLCYDLVSNSTVSGGVDGISEYKWIYSNGVTFSSKEDSIHSNCLQNNTVNPIILGVTLEVTSDEGCVGTMEAPNLIEVYHNPIADFDYRGTADDGGADIFNTEVDFINESRYAHEYEWEIEDVGTFDDEEFSYDFDDEPREYRVDLMAITENGCKDSVYQIVDVKDVVLFYVPNAFTPDFDAHNQIWKPVFTSGFDPLDFNLLIFNRWGEVVWESNDASVGWDGTYGTNSNELVKDGTYIWKIEFKETMSDRRHTHSGQVTLIR